MKTYNTRPFGSWVRILLPFVTIFFLSNCRDLRFHEHFQLEISSKCDKKAENSSTLCKLHEGRKGLGRWDLMLTYSPYVRFSNTILDSGFHAVDSKFQDSGIQSLAGFWIPSSEFRIQAQDSLPRAKFPRTHHFHIDLNAPCSPPQIFHNRCSQFLLGIIVIPREN